MFDAIVLNEASLPFESADDCEKNIEIFFKLLHEAKLHNVQFARADAIDGSWGQLNYADDFEFGRWLNSIDDKERQRQVKSVLSNVKCPLKDMNDNMHGIDVKNTLYVLASDENLEVLGLGFASLNNSHGLSFLSDVCWKESYVSILRCWDENGAERKELLDVPNIATTEQLEPYLDNFRAQRRKNKKYLEKLSVENNPEFPNLLFTESVIKSLKSSSLQPLDFTKVVSVLHKLDEAIVSSDNLMSLTANSGLNISVESETTMSNKALVRLRTFKHPVNGNQVFEAHVKNFTDGKRMHILADFKSKKLCIGYFGKHLKTSGE